MYKRYFFIFMAIAIGDNLVAQMPTAAEIKKMKIKKISTTTRENGENAATTTIIYYDAIGNDTARYTDGKRISYKIIKYDTKQRPETITSFSPEGKETEKTIFTYKPDGSYTSLNTDARFGMKNNYQYDKNGKLLQLTIPEGSVLKYVYNSKGLLTKLYSIPKGNGVKFTTTYTYNEKNKLIVSKSTGGNPVNNKYEYDSTGLLKKSESISAEYSITSTYEYGY